MTKFQHKDIYRNARFAGQVTRYHTWPVQRDQSTGEHTWQMLRIYCQIFGPPSPAATMHMVWHDAGELVAGDSPGMLKELAPDIKPILDRVECEAVEDMGGPPSDDLLGLDGYTRLQIKICDLIDVYELGLVEVLQGNRLAEPIVAWADGGIQRRRSGLRPNDDIRVMSYLATVREKLQQ